MRTTKSLSVYFHRNFKTFQTQFLPSKNVASPLCPILLYSPYFSLSRWSCVDFYLCFVTIPENPDANILGARPGHRVRLVLTFRSAVISTKLLQCLFPLQRNFTTYQVYYFLKLCLLLCFTTIDIATFIF